MNRNIVLVLGVILLLAAGAAGWLTRSQLESAPDIVPDSALPADDGTSRVVAFSIPDLDGNLRSLDEWAGKARIVNFWATWCAPCRREIPLLKKTQDAHGDDGVQIIGVAVDFVEEVEAYAEEAAFNYPILVGQEEAMAAAAQTGVEFIGLPFTMIVAPGGELLHAHLGEIHEPQIETIVDVFAGLRDGTLDLAAASEQLKSL